MKFLILGTNGQVGWELQRAFALKGTVLSLARKDFGGDLLKPAEIEKKIVEFAPDAVINAAAYTAVDKAESEQDLAFKINSQAVEHLAKVCKIQKTLLVHFSTDYVFDGSGSTPWSETDPVSPINTYGQSKLAGEKAIEQLQCDALIFRTSWVYGVHGKNFIKTILRLAQTKESLNVVNDQFGAPTSAEFIADVAAELSMRVLNNEKHLKGIYHLVPNGETNWCDFARWIVSKAESLNFKLSLEAEKIRGIRSSQYPTVAKRPNNSRLNNNKLKELFPEGTIHNWDVYARRVLVELSGQ